MIETKADRPARPSGTVIVGLAELPADALLDAGALGEVLGRCKRSVERAVRRGDLPAPFVFMGRNTWTAGAVVEHFRAKQEAALEAARRRDARIAQDNP